MIHFYTKQDLEETKSGDYQVNINDDLESARQFAKYSKLLAMDTETHGLNYHSPDHLLLIQFGTEHIQFVIDVNSYSREELEFIKELLEDESKTKVFHNSDYDINTFHNYYKELDEKNIQCTYKASKVAFNGFNYSHSMDACSKRLLGTEVSKYMQQAFINHTKGKKFKLDQIIYSAIDIIVTSNMYFKLLVELTSKELSHAYNLEMQVPYAAISRAGIPFDKEMWLSNADSNKKKLYEVQIEMDKYLLKHHFELFYDIALPLSLFSGQYRLLDLNWNSSSQVLKVFDKLGIKIKDKHGKITTGRKDIYKYLNFKDNGNEFLELYSEYAELKNKVSTFGEGYLYNKDKVTGKSVSTVNVYTGRIHSSYDPVKNTGRMGQFGPNLQQVPSSDEFRSCFRVNEDSKLITSDYASQESRVMASLSNDTEFLNFFNNPDNEYKGDMHSFVGTKLFSAMEGREVRVSKGTKDLRQKAKVLNFMISFGGSDYTLSQELNLPIEECKKLIDSFFTAFPDLSYFFDYNKKQALSKGYIINNDITLRKRFFPEWEHYKEMKEEIDHFIKHNDDPFTFFKENRDSHIATINREAYKLKGDIERAAMNCPVQGTAGDMTKKALALLYIKLDSRYAKIVNVIHDEIVVESVNDYVDTASNLVQSSMSEAGKIFCPNVDLTPIPEIHQVWAK